MTYDAQHHRRSLRLPDHNYSARAAYFVSLVTRDREHLFGQIMNGEMYLNDLGELVREEWERTPEIRPGVDIDTFVVMPNHTHLIVIVGAHSCAPLLDKAPMHKPFREPRSLGSLVACFKATATRKINQMRGTPGLPVWQRNYYEHVIRDDEDMDRIRAYIADNPTRWDEDPENI